MDYDDSYDDSSAVLVFVRPQAPQAAAGSGDLGLWVVPLAGRRQLRLSTLCFESKPTP